MWWPFKKKEAARGDGREYRNGYARGPGTPTPPVLSKGSYMASPLAVKPPKPPHHTHPGAIPIVTPREEYTGTGNPPPPEGIQRPPAPPAPPRPILLDENDAWATEWRAATDDERVEMIRRDFKDKYSH